MKYYNLRVFAITLGQLMTRLDRPSSALGFCRAALKTNLTLSLAKSIILLGPVVVSLRISL